VQADGKNLWRAALALAIEHIEGVAHIDEKIIRRGKTAVLIEAVVIGLI
jgi:hypothetical protein